MEENKVFHYLCFFISERLSVNDEKVMYYLQNNSIKEFSVRK